MTIHHTDPFATPEDQRSPVRRLRGRLPSPVTLWTAPGPAGLTVSSTVVVDGEPGHVLGVLDDESDLWAAIEAGGLFAVTPLDTVDNQLADRFAGLLPAPGGPFRYGCWQETGYGPVPAEHPTWAGCVLVDARPVGWGLLVDATIEYLELGTEPAKIGTEPTKQDGPSPLVHHRGRYRRLG